MPSTLKRTLTLCGFVGLLTVVCAEIASCPASRILADRSIMYDPQASSMSLADYLASRDPELGWPNSRVFGTGEFDRAGSRIVPAFPDPNAATCASIYGDSFAWGEEVDAEHAWGNVLSQGLGCRVANYGVPGFAPDQAYMRYVRSKDDRSQVVILTHLSENIQRNLNRFRNLLMPADAPVLKPRFVLNAAGELELVPIYTPKDEADLRTVMEHPEAVLHDEWFVPGGPAGVATRRFPYLLNITRVLTGYKMRAALHGRATHAEFYERDHPAHGLQISVGIAKAFAREATSRGALPLVLIIPLPTDFTDARKSGRWPYAPMTDELTRARVPVLDAGPLFEAHLKGADPCSLYVRCAGGHFNENGYRLLGEYVRDWLNARRPT